MSQDNAQATTTGKLRTYGPVAGRNDLDDGGWYKIAQGWHEASHFDGQHHVSTNTHSQWDHEELVLTTLGAWVITTWSQWRDVHATARLVSSREAATWLVRNRHDLPERLCAVGQV